MTFWYRSVIGSKVVGGGGGLLIVASESYPYILLVFWGEEAVATTSIYVNLPFAVFNWGLILTLMVFLSFSLSAFYIKEEDTAALGAVSYFLGYYGLYGGGGGIMVPPPLLQISKVGE